MRARKNLSQAEIDAPSFTRRCGVRRGGSKGQPILKGFSSEEKDCNVRAPIGYKKNLSHERLYQNSYI